MNAQLSIQRDMLASFCREHGIRRLAVFGSALRDDFGPDSDVDVLVEFEPGRVPGLIGVAGLELALSPLFAGRKVDLRTPEDLSRYFRQDVLDTAEVLVDEDEDAEDLALARAIDEAMTGERVDRETVFAVLRDPAARAS